MSSRRQPILTGAEFFSNLLDRRGVIEHLDLLVSTQIDRYLKDRFGADSRILAERIHSVYDLADLVRRPVLLDMVCSTIPYFPAEVEVIFEADLYSRYILEHLNRDIESRRLQASPESRMADIEQLAEYIIRTDRLRVPRSVFGTEILVEERSLDSFVVSSFLLRDPEGNYEFSHRSFLEYFGALRMLRDLCEYRLRSSIWSLLENLSLPQVGFFCQLTVSAELEILFPDSTGPKNTPDVLATEEAERIVTSKKFQEFKHTTGYEPLTPDGNHGGFAAVSWPDAVAFCLWAGARLPTRTEVLGMVAEDFACLDDATVGAGSPTLFSFSEPGWKRIVSGTGRRNYLRGEREWVWDAGQVEGRWTNLEGERHLNTYSCRPAKSSRAIFRVVPRRRPLNI